jgi:drug/metabolite transporter (DMT)-like permease
MSVAMASFTCNDALVKSVTPFANVGQIMFVRGVLTTALVFLIAWRMGALRHPRVVLQPMILLRLAMELIATVTYVSALGLVPLGNAASILQALPLAVTLGAALFLKQPVGWRRWSAIITGFIGVLIIVRPGPDGFALPALLVLLGMFASAVRDLITHRIHADVPSLTITAYTVLASTLLGGLLIQPMGGWHPMNGTTVSHLALASLFVLSGYQMLILAMRSGEISFVAPFRYVSLLWAIGIGLVFFGEIPDVWMLIGAAIVIASGLYTFYRENKRRSMAMAQQSSPATSH